MDFKTYRDQCKWKDHNGKCRATKSWCRNPDDCATYQVYLLTKKESEK